MSISVNDTQSKQYKEFEYLINSNKDKSLESILQNLIESDLVNIESLINHDNVLNISNIKLKNTVLLISRGNLEKYYSNKNEYIPLSEKMVERLKVNTFLEIISTEKEVKFDSLKVRLELENDYEVLSFLFKMFIRQYFKGKIDEENRILSIFDVKPRDFISNWSQVKNRLVNMIRNIEEYENLLISHPDQIRCCNEEFNHVLIRKENERAEKEKKINKI